MAGIGQMRGTTSRETPVGPVDLEPVGETEAEVGGHRLIWLIGSWAAVVVLAAVAALALGAVEATDDTATVETITDLAGLRSAIPDTAERSRPFRMTMELDVGSAGGAPAPPGMSMVLRSDGQHSMTELTTMGRTISMVASTDTIYLPTVGGEGWVAFRMPDAEAAATSAFGAADPLAMLDAMSSTHPVELLGRETIDDIDVMHYRVRNDMGGLLEDTATSESQREAMARLGFGALPSMTVDAWIDTEGVLRRMDIRIDADATAITMVMRIDDVEEAFQITIPDVAEGPYDVDATDPTGRFHTHLTALLTG